MAWKAGDRIQCDMNVTAITVDTDPDGMIKGKASTPSVDLAGHKVLAKAFDDSIKRKGLTGPRGVKLLAFHDWTKPAGVIKRLETVGQDLEIDAQLNLGISYVKDMHAAARDNGGLSFSVGFRLEDFEFVEDKDGFIDMDGDDGWLVVKKGDLMEISVVTFPCQLEAEMTFVKQEPPNTLSEFEKALVAEGICQSRSEARRITLAVKNSAHLFLDKPRPVAKDVITPQRPWLDAHKLQAAMDLTSKAKAILTSR